MEKNSPVSIIIPVHNGARHLECTIDAIRERMAECGMGSYEICIAEDGSTDHSAKIAKSLANKYSNVRAFTFPSRLGKGAALSSAIRKCNHGKILFLDSYLSSGTSEIPQAILLLDDYDMVAGSRHMAGAQCKRAGHRAILGKIYCHLANMLFPKGISDYQCGFKSFRKEKMLALLEKVKSKGWFWDTEVILLAKSSDWKIKELPVRWEERESTSLNVLETGAELLCSLLLFRLNAPRV